MSEPMWLDGDDFALDDVCDWCDNAIDDCECAEDDPDKLHDGFYDE